MTTLGKIAALGSGTAAAAAIAVSVALMQSKSSPGAPRQTPQDRSGIVCVASDGVLHSGGAGAGCADGQTELALDGSSSPSTQHPTDPLSDVEQRLAKLEKSAVFEVVDKSGRRIFTVGQQGMAVYNRDQVPAAGIRATDDGGFFVGRSAEEPLSVSIGASGDNVGVRVVEGDTARLDLGKQTAGNYSLKLHAKGGGDIAGFGESKAGTGAAIVGDDGGRVRASMSVANDAGMVTVFNATSNAAILTLSQGATGGGVLAIGDAKSEPMVKMGGNGDRYGVVLTGPRAGFPLIPSSGLPGSYILGCAGGDGCRPY